MTTYCDIDWISFCFKLVLACESKDFKTILWYLNLIWKKYLLSGILNRATDISTEAVHNSTGSHNIPYPSNYWTISRRIGPKLVRGIANEIFVFINNNNRLLKRQRLK